MPEDTQTLPEPTPDPQIVAGEGALQGPAALLPKGSWRLYPAPIDQVWPRMVRRDRPLILWRPADGTVAVPARRKGGWAYLLVSREDAPWVLACNWYLSKSGYGVRNVVIEGRSTQQYLHRLVRCAADGKDILLTSPTDLVDHKNVIPTDCRRRNLRWSNKALNSTNLGREHPGVTWNEYRQRWTARLKHEGKEIHVCYSRSKRHAIRMRAERAKELGIPLNGEAPTRS